MSIIITAFAFILMLSILVVVHEWGHFIVARICGIRVDEFSIGFGPRALRIGKLGDTEYNIRWIPLGGYVKIAGMEADEEPLLRARDKVQELTGSKPNEEAKEAAELTNLPLVGENTPNFAETPEQKKRDERDGFYAHPIWQRSLVIFAGPFMSFVLGYVLIFGISMALGVPEKVLNVIDSVMPGSEAQKIGLAPGDKILSIDGKTITDGKQMVDLIHGNVNKKVTLVIIANGLQKQIVGVPQPIKDEDGKQIGILGFSPKSLMRPASIEDSFQTANSFTDQWFSTVVALFARHNLKEIRGSMGGTIFIAKATDQAVKSGGVSYPFLIAQLSMSLALFNLLPIPILDGGHLLIFAIEGLRRGRRLTLEQQQSFMLAGLAIIGVLFVLIMFNDIMRTIHPIGP